MMKFRSKAIGGLALAVASVTALAACSSSSSGSATASPTTSGAVTQPGSIGAIPAAGTPSGTAGSITYGYLSSNAPNWIFPITTAAANSVYNVFVFDWQMWRPLYYYPQGTTITVDQQLSVADPPVWSNGDKTMSITLKNWKWSNGQTLSSKDLLFTMDEIAAAVKASPANWSAYVPGFFPSTITSMSTPNASTLVVNMKSAVNPTWMEQDILSAIMVMPAAEWAKDSASGPTLDFTQPANALKIFNYLTAQAKSVNTYATNPLWQTVYGPYKLTSFNATTGAFTFVPNTAYSGPHATPQSTFVGVPFTSNAAQFNAIKSGSVDVAAVPPEDAPQISTLKGIGYNYFGIPAFGDYFVAYNFLDKTGDFNNIVAQLYFRQAMQHLEDQEGQIKAYLNGDGVPGYTTISQYPQTPFYPSNATTNPYPFSVSTAESVLKANGWNVVPNGTDTCAHAGTARGRLRGRHPGRHQAGLQPDLQHHLADHPGSRGPGLQRQAGRHPDHPVGQQLQLHDPELQRRGVAREREQVGRRGLRRRGLLPLPHRVRVPEHQRVRPDRQLQQPDRGLADQRLHHQPQPAGGHERAGVLRDEPAGDVAAVARPHLRL